MSGRSTRTATQLSSRRPLPAVERGFRLLSHFDHNRIPVFHYAMFVHYLGIPVSNDVLSPDYHVPRNTSGIAHKPGGDLAIALGGWRYDDPAGCQPNPTVALNPSQVYCNDRLGTALNQAGTLMHELGHNGRLGHGGLENSINC